MKFENKKKETIEINLKGTLGLVGLPIAGAAIGFTAGSNLNAACKAAVIGASAIAGAASLVAIDSAIDDVARSYSEVEDTVSGIFEKAAEVFKEGFSDESFEKVFGE